MSIEIVDDSSLPLTHQGRQRTNADALLIPVIPRTQFDFDVAIVGLGYVGLPTALSLHAAGLRVLGVDVSERRLAVIRSGEADLLESDRERLETAMSGDDFQITGDTYLLGDAAAVIICVPTPIDEHLTPDLEILASACTMVVDAAVPGQLLMLTSTTYPGCTRDLLVTPLLVRGLTAGKDIFVSFSPERIDPGNDRYAHEDVPRVVGGATPVCQAAGAALLGRYARNIHGVSSLEVAEMSKLLENTFRAVNIALANEFAEACLALGLSVIEVINAAATKPYGFMPFFPGAGVGGHCIPCDPHYLLWQLRKAHVDAPVIEHAMSEIAGRPRRVLERVRETLADQGKPLRGARVLVVGVSYKPNVADLRESPALDILSMLADQGADVGFHDPFFGSVRLRNGRELTATVDPDAFGADLVVLHTDHDNVDWEWLSPEVLVLDTTYRRTDLPRRVQL
ncbi:nucleotide sugar dehydrogenase [Cryobacterium sp. 10I1]|uniref:nucleotide sugar dehydrogenase n=1 Tax=unclassified Cryobacterium TaxID=2649013 RepID=UPI002B2306C8|nr:MULTISPECIES: nucleotide sugar dehydrogenase [unclassified Cryobacterium]MEB0002353.1 nucleotide sugar dehydrogenase [Cryobacterium sp. RTC2.1]MEB0306250.1 nucleotide sugar dehydrogenase [Cryobacterium sp. 10I1]